MHRDIAKVFYEELFPLYRLLQNKLREWEDVRFKPIIGNQNYDVEVESQRNSVPRYIEIVITNRDEAEHARMEYFSDHGYVNMVGNVSIVRNRRNGKRIYVDEEAHSSAEVNQKIRDRISEVIDKKIKVRERPTNTALLVFFDDYTAFRYDLSSSRTELDAFLDSIKIKWYERYSALYAVGASGQSFYEQRRLIQ